MNVGAKSYPIRPKYLQIKFCDSLTLSLSLSGCVCVCVCVCVHFLGCFFFLTEIFLLKDFKKKKKLCDCSITV